MQSSPQRQPFKVFVVSLAHVKERRAFMRAQLSKFNFEYEFIDAIPAATIPEEEVAAINARRVHDTDLTKGWVAAGKSHAKACRALVADGREFGVVLEDDVLLGDDLPEILNALLEVGDTTRLTLLYGLMSKRVTLRKTRDLLRGYGLTEADDNTHVWGGQGYFISREKARAYADALNEPVTVIDDWSTYVKQGVFGGLTVVYPFPVLHAEFLSAIRPARGNSLRTSIKNLLYYNKVFPAYQLFLWHRRRLAEQRQRGFIHTPDFSNKKTYKL